MAAPQHYLYIGICRSGLTDSAVPARPYRWELLIATEPQDQPGIPGIRLHLRASGVHWVYAELSLPEVQIIPSMFARLLVAEITDQDRLMRIVRSTPLRHNDRTWSDRNWVHDVLSRLAHDAHAVGLAQLDFDVIEARAYRFIQTKSHAGRYASSSAPSPTWDMLRGTERLP